MTTTVAQARTDDQRRADRALWNALMTRTGQQRPWTGPVERRDPATYRMRSVILTWMCSNPFCRQWTMRGAYLTGRCNFCQTPRTSPSPLA